MQETSNDKEIFFSVIIPCYNRAAFLGKTVNTVLEQTFQNFEIIIVDDGSTDGTADLVQDLQKSDSRIHYVYQENKERGAARNNGIRHSKGQWLVFHDSDDDMYSNRLQVLFEYIQKFPSANVLVTKFHYLINGRKKEISTQKAIEPGWQSKQVILNGNHFACNYCVRREEPIIMFEEDRKYAIMEDWMYAVKNLENQPLLVIENRTLGMNVHDGRSMKGGNEKIINAKKLATNWITEHIHLTPVEEKMLWGGAYYFCSIHAYLDKNKTDALLYLNKAVRQLGWNYNLIKLRVRIALGI